ncbi:phage baseplate assembly protein V [Desulfovibrio sp. ZJ200]|uniref:phage baseplate assembly protein V n=1 Tax=Desulfovibrio sp. ZJ200 TaxID=2709792 RepID=UPI0013EC37C0|nr:phage baseplate assembly protein V [Desulfovibrio sp. ZJ200]
MFDYATLERRVAALEANRGASLRFGRVVGVEGGSARVRLDDGQGMVSAPLPTLQRRVLKDQEIKLPDDNEPVAVLFSGQGLEAGVVLGACYSPSAPDPQQARQMDYCRFVDGTVIFYDRAAHKLYASVEGDAEIKTRGTITARAEKDILAESATSITLRAPTITLAGLLRVTDKDGNAGSGDLLGSYRILHGGLDVPDADVTAGNVSVRGHIHKGVQSGNGTTQEPVGG